MKRLIIVVLLVSFVLPSVVFADTESELVGTWVGSSEFYYGEVSYFMFRFYDDHKAIYQTNEAKMYDDDPFSIVNAGTWELKEDGVHVYHYNYWNKKEENEVVLVLTQAHYLAMKLATSYIMFVKLPERKSIGSFHIVENWD